MLFLINISVLFIQENKINLVERACTEVVWLRLGTKGRAFVTKVMKHPDPQKVGNFLKIWGSIVLDIEKTAAQMKSPTSILRYFHTYFPHYNPFRSIQNILYSSCFSQERYMPRPVLILSLQGAEIKIRNTCFHKKSASYPQSTTLSITLSEKKQRLFSWQH